MRAGFGKNEITPDIGTELAGFGYYLNRTARTVTDPLFARAVMLEHDDVLSLIISCDLLGLSREVCTAINDHAAAKYGISPASVLIVSVHTHCGPTIKYHEGCGYVCDEYVARLPGLICAAIDAAYTDMACVTGMTHSMAEVPGDHIYNRASADGPVDRSVRGFILCRESRPDIAMISAACHGVFRGRMAAVSADFSGEVNRQLTGMGYDAIYLNGLCGDIDPYKPTDARMQEYAELLVTNFLSAQRPISATLTSHEAGFTLKLTPVTREDIESAAKRAVETAGGPDIPQAKVALRWREEMLEKLDRLEAHEGIIIKYLILGGVPVMALPFEGFTRIGMDIRRICGREDALILGCAEELLGYLPTRDDIARGAYAALESTFLYKRLPVVPGEAERLGAAMGAALLNTLSAG